MQKFLMLLVILLTVSCTMVEAGKVSDERKELYTRNNNEEFCRANPNKCIDGIPWM